MDRGQIPLNALRAFEASARHLSFTRAGVELRVSQAAVSHQVKALEERLGAILFRRLPRGLALTDEGAALVPVLGEAFDGIGALLDRFATGRFQEVLTIGVVGTFAVGWLMERLPLFHRAYPFVDLRVMTNNNRVDLAGEGLDYAIRFGDGHWHGTEAETLIAAPFSPLCSPEIAKRIGQPGDLANEILLRSYRVDEWAEWFKAAGASCPNIRGAIFDSSLAIATIAIRNGGIGLLPITMFENELSSGSLVQPFPTTVETGSYWLTRLCTKRVTPAMTAFRDWITGNP